MSVPLITIYRSQQSQLQYQLDFRLQDFVATQNLASATVTVLSGTITVSNVSVSGKVVRFTLSGSTAGKAKLRVIAVAADGQQMDQPVDVITQARP